MKEKQQTTPPRKVSKKKFIAGVVLFISAILAMYALSFVVPAVMEEVSIGRYDEGPKKRLAERVGREASVNDLTRIVARWRTVEKVEALTDEELKKYPCTDENPQSIYHYKIIITDRTLFGLPYDSYTLKGCNF